MSILQDNAMIILNGLAERFNGHTGLWVHAKNKSKIENWLQVELCSILKPLCYDNEEIEILTDKQHNSLNGNNIDILIKYNNPLCVEVLELKIIVIGQSTSDGIKSLLEDYARICLLPGTFVFDNSPATLAGKGVLFLFFPSGDLGGNRALEGVNGYFEDVEGGVGDLQGLGEYDPEGGLWFSVGLNFTGGEPNISGKIYLKLA